MHFFLNYVHTHRMMVCVGWYERMQRKIWHIPRANLDKKMLFFKFKFDLFAL